MKRWAFRPGGEEGVSGGKAQGATRARRTVVGLCEMTLLMAVSADGVLESSVQDSVVLTTGPGHERDASRQHRPSSPRELLTREATKKPVLGPPRSQHTRWPAVRPGRCPRLARTLQRMRPARSQTSVCSTTWWAALRGHRLWRCRLASAPRYAARGRNTAGAPQRPDHDV